MTPTLNVTCHQNMRSGDAYVGTRLKKNKKCMTHFAPISVCKIHTSSPRALIISIPSIPTTTPLHMQTVPAQRNDKASKHGAKWKGGRGRGEGVERKEAGVGARGREKGKDLITEKKKEKKKIYIYIYGSCGYKSRLTRSNSYYYSGIQGNS